MLDIAGGAAWPAATGGACWRQLEGWRMKNISQSLIALLLLACSKSSPAKPTERFDSTAEAPSRVRADAAAADWAAAGGDAASADGGPQIEFLEPMFFSLPINSVRYGVSGYDPSNDLCISVIWFLNSVEQTRFCGVTDSFRPYVWIERAQPAGCWGYGPNADVFAVRGCVDFGDFTDPADDSVDLEADISSPEWSGTVRFASSP